MYKVITGNLIHSKHRTREEAEAEVFKTRKEAFQTAERLREEADDEEDYASNLKIEEDSPQTTSKK